MRIKYIISLLLLVAFSFIAHAQETISSGSLSIEITKNSNGAKISSIKNNGLELLSSRSDSYFFSLSLKNTSDHNTLNLNALSGWQNIQIENHQSLASISFSQPANATLPESLRVEIDINTNDLKSSWDISVSGLGEWSLLEAKFPVLYIADNNQGTFMTPYFGGKLYQKIQTNRFNYDGLYPRGWGTTMQFMAYYHSDSGIYFGFHDPDASIKWLGAVSGNNAVKVFCQIPVPDKTLPGNDWNLSGFFELDLFEGDWYDATLIYKDWVVQKANYYPKDTPEREARLQEIGRIGAWFYNYLSDNDGNVNIHTNLINTC